MITQNFRPSQKALHWATFLLVFGLYGITYIDDLFDRGSAGRAWVWWLHISFGLLLVPVVLARIAARLRFGAPALPSAMNRLERLGAHGAHLGLYALLIVTPALGVITAWYRNMPASFFGLFVIASPFAPDRDAARQVQHWHNLAATAIIVLAVAHAAAALWHHFIRRDDVLARMLPDRV
jgi:cytochrome b561